MRKPEAIVPLEILIEVDVLGKQRAQTAEEMGFLNKNYNISMACLDDYRCHEHALVMDKSGHNGDRRRCHSSASSGYS